MYFKLIKSVIITVPFVLNIKGLVYINYSTIIIVIVLVKKCN